MNRTLSLFRSGILLVKPYATLEKSYYICRSRINYDNKLRRRRISYRHTHGLCRFIFQLSICGRGEKRH